MNALTADVAAAGELPADLERGLAVLVTSPPLWPIEAAQWAAAVASVRAFAWRWGVQARGLGWPEVALYGLHRRAPYANLAGMGAAWLMARSGRRDFEIAPEVMLIPTRTGDLLLFRGAPPDPDSVLAWHLCGEAGACAARSMAPPF